jgi:hypothetical protein
MIPESPPIRNIEMKPRAKQSGVVKRMRPPQRVASQLKIFTPVGMPISIVPIANAASATGPSPTVNMWWLQTPKPKKAIRIPE